MKVPGEVLAEYPDLFALILVLLLTGELALLITLKLFSEGVEMSESVHVRIQQEYSQKPHSCKQNHSFQRRVYTSRPVSYTPYPGTILESLKGWERDNYF